METWWRSVVWAQFGAAIDMLEQPLLACPDSLWTTQLWSIPADSGLPPDSGAFFWYVAYHALFWLDLYLSGAEEGFAPPEPFTLEELDPAGALPPRVYTKDELHTYLQLTRHKCRALLAALSEEQARRPIAFPWTRGQTFTYLELQLYNMRHVQEHAAQLSLWLGQHDIHVAKSWVARATS